MDTMKAKYHYETYRYYKDWAKDRIECLDDLRGHTKKSILAGGVFRDSIYRALIKAKATSASIRCRCGEVLRIDESDHPTRDFIELH